MRSREEIEIDVDIARQGWAFRPRRESRECFDGTSAVRKKESKTWIERWIEGYLQLPKVKVPVFLDADSSWKRVTTARCTVLIPDSIHLPVGSEAAEGLGFAVTLRLGATFFGHIGFLTDTIGIVGEGDEDPGTKLLVKENGEWGTRNGVERVESREKESIWTWFLIYIEAIVRISNA